MNKTNLYKALTLLGFGLLGTVTGIFLENTRRISSPFGLVIAIVSVGAGLLVMSRMGKV